MIEFKCSQCGETMQAPESLAGETEKCPKCGALRRVPGQPGVPTVGSMSSGTSHETGKFPTVVVEPTTLIELTSKRWKKLKLQGIALMLVSVVGLIPWMIGFIYMPLPLVVTAGCLIALVFVLGTAIGVYAEIMAWWYHG